MMNINSENKEHKKAGPQAALPFGLSK